MFLFDQALPEDDAGVEGVLAGGHDGVRLLGPFVKVEPFKHQNVDPIAVGRVANVLVPVPNLRVLHALVFVPGSECHAEDGVEVVGVEGEELEDGLEEVGNGDAVSRDQLGLTSSPTNRVGGKIDVGQNELVAVSHRRHGVQ